MSKNSGGKYGWFTVAQIVEFTGLADPTVRQRILTQIPDSSIDKTTKKFLYHGKAVCDVLSNRKQIGDNQSTQNGQPKAKTLDPLEEVKLQREMIKLERERLSIVSTERVQKRMTQIAQMLRTCGEQLQTKYGKDAYRLLDQTLIQAEKIIQESYASEDSGDVLGE